GWVWSLQFTSVAVSTLLVCSSPIWTAAYDSVVHRRTLPRLGWLGFCCGAIGLAMVLHSGTTRVPIPGHESTGYSLALGGSVAIAAYLMLVREVRSQLSTRDIVTRTYTYAAVALALAALLTHQGPPVLANTTAWLGILGMALISQSLGHTAINVSLHFFSPSAISFATLFEPVVAAVLAAILFGETLGGLTLLGGCIVLLSIGTVLYAEADWARN
ncbi:MAG: DMT family transporter, partial [Candidatus Eremiobacteraeota bacterium]|nr:DMT family transporter [Candidatus Eremiobacteraeota bacterium]